MRRAPRLTPDGLHWVWTWEPFLPVDGVPKEWVIPPRHGPLAIPQEDLLMEVDEADLVIDVDPPAVPVVPVQPLDPV